MKRDNRQRLFEVLAKVDDTFKKPELGPVIHVKHTDIPPEIISWAKSIIGSGFQNNITIRKSNGIVEIGMPWHDADRETHQYFKLVGDGAAVMGDPVSRSGWSEVAMFDKFGGKSGYVPIPSGYVLATVGTYPRRLKIITSPDAMNLLPDNSEALDKLSDEAMVALYQAKSYKSFARQKFNDSAYEELLSSGLMNKQRAITIDGRNFISSPEAIKRLKEIKEKDEKENGRWSTKYYMPSI